MKSTNEQLKKRGLWIEEYKAVTENKSEEELLDMLKQKEAWMRSAAVHELTKRSLHTEMLEDAVLHVLRKEPALYTRLLLCDYLKQGNLDTCKRMLPWLGKLENHQYHELPDRISKKKSYPIARDIIARTMAQMDPYLIPHMCSYLLLREKREVSELLDAVGYQLFYHKEYADETAYDTIISVMKNNVRNDVIYWKCIMCLSAFAKKECELVLIDVIHQKQGLIKEEAMKSLETIRGRKNDTL